VTVRYWLTLVSQPLSRFRFVSRCRTYRFLLEPTGRQRSALGNLLGTQCELYNAALEERRGAWRWEQHSINFFDQSRELTELRAVRPEVLAYGVTVCRGTLKRLDRAFSAFYRRCRQGQKPGYPRFKSVRRFDSVQWEDTKGWSLNSESRRLYLQGIGHVKTRLHRPLRGTPKAITVRREGRRWWVSIRCVDVPATPLPETGREVGIDLGVRWAVATSDGQLVAPAFIPDAAPSDWRRPNVSCRPNAGGRVTGPGPPAESVRSTGRWPTSARSSPTSCRGLS